MVRTLVSSSMLASVGYDEQKQILEIEFHSGGVYQYLGVPSQVYLDLMAAASHGTYFDQNIKKADYSYKRVS